MPSSPFCHFCLTTISGITLGYCSRLFMVWQFMAYAWSKHNKTQHSFIHSFIHLFIHLYWSIIALQWCVSFCFITKWISYTYTYIPISPPSWVSLPSSLSHPSRWSQSTKLISLCYAAETQHLKSNKAHLSDASLSEQSL